MYDNYTGSRDLRYIAPLANRSSGTCIHLYGQIMGMPATGPAAHLQAQRIAGEKVEPHDVAGEDAICHIQVGSPGRHHISNNCTPHRPSQPILMRASHATSIVPSRRRATDYHRYFSTLTYEVHMLAEARIIIHIDSSAMPEVRRMRCEKVRHGGLTGNTHANGDGDEVDQPEEDVFAMEANRIEDACRDHQRHKQDDHQLLYHLGQKIGHCAVQAVTALPA